MLTNLYLWAIYTASYFLCFAIELIDAFNRSWRYYVESLGEKAPNLIDFIKSLPVVENVEIIALIILLGFSLLVIASLRQIDFNTRYKGIPEKNVTFDILGYVATQVVTVITVVFSDWGLLISLGIFVVAGVFWVLSRKVHFCPLFVFPLGYRIYESGADIMIAKGSRDHIRLKMQDNPNGLEARELEPRIYLIRSVK